MTPRRATASAAWMASPTSERGSAFDAAPALAMRACTRPRSAAWRMTRGPERRSADGVLRALRFARDDVVERHVTGPGRRHELGEGRRDRVDRVPVDRGPHRTATGRTAASPASPRAGSAVHSNATAPDVKPAPKATHHDLVADLRRGPRSPPPRARSARTPPTCCRSGRGSRTSSSIGRSRPLATDSMMRMLAWCGMNRSISSGCQPGLADRRQGRRRQRLGREAVGLLALHADVVLAARDRLGRGRALRAAGRQPDHVGAVGVGRQLDAERRRPARPRPTAPPRRRRRRTGCRCCGRCSRGSASAARRRSRARAWRARARCRPRPSRRRRRSPSRRP